MDIRYREIQESDFEYIKELAYIEWFSEYPFKRVDIEQYCNGYLYHYLAKSDFRCVATDGKKVIGFLFGSCKNIKLDDQPKFKRKLYRLGFKMLFNKVGRRGIKIHLAEEKANKKMKKKNSNLLKNELCLFIVNKDYRNLHIGSTLLRKFEEFLTLNNEKDYFLFTDTFSSFDFYERKGFKQLDSIDVDFKVKSERTEVLPKYFIYYKELKKTE